MSLIAAPRLSLIFLLPPDPVRMSSKSMTAAGVVGGASVTVCLLVAADWSATPAEVVDGSEDVFVIEASFSLEVVLVSVSVVDVVSGRSVTLVSKRRDGSKLNDVVEGRIVAAAGLICSPTEAEFGTYSVTRDVAISDRDETNDVVPLNKVVK